MNLVLSYLKFCKKQKKSESLCFAFCIYSDIYKDLEFCSSVYLYNSEELPSPYISLERITKNSHPKPELWLHCPLGVFLEQCLTSLLKS